nr:hypothetical protein [Kofleriaceae bacterium]
MSTGGQLATVLRERSSEILATWIARFERSLLRFRRATKASDHTAQVASLVEALGVAAVGGASALRPGSDAARELERAAAFIGARFASEGATGFDVAALLLELRDSCTPIVPRDDAAAIATLFEWLTVIAQDAFATSGLQSLREQVAEQLEVGTPVVEMMPKVPAVLLVGAPNTSTLDNLLARAWMLAVGSGAPCLIIDCNGLAKASSETVFDKAYRAFLRQAEGSALQILLSNARRPLRERAAAMTGEHNLSFQHFDRLDSAVGHAMERAGYHLVKRS